MLIRILNILEFQQGSFVTAESIMAFYETHKENLTFKLDNRAIGKIISEAWHSEVVKTRHFKKMAYFNLSFRSKTVNEFHLGEQLWKSLPNECPKNWSCKMPSSEIIDFCKIQDVRKDSMELVLMITARNSLEGISISIRYIGGEVTPVILGIWPTNIVQDCNELQQLFTFMENSILCHGVELEASASEINDITDKNGKTMSTIHRIYESSSSDTHHFITSTKCLVIANDEGHCNECAYVSRKHQIKHEWRVEKEVDLKCNNRYLSNKEMKCKIELQKKKLRAAEEKVRRLRLKLQEEMWLVDEEDHRDYCQMFEMVNDKNPVPDGLNILFEEQKKQLNTKSKNGHRWHPR